MGIEVMYNDEDLFPCKDFRNFVIENLQFYIEEHFGEDIKDIDYVAISLWIESEVTKMDLMRLLGAFIVKNNQLNQIVSNLFDGNK